jgi:hypothetical protein
MTVYIAGPDGFAKAFADEAEPPLLRVLRKHRDEVLHLQKKADCALSQRKGRTEAFSYIESSLRTLNSRMFCDID